MGFQPPTSPVEHPLQQQQIPPHLIPQQHQQVQQPQQQQSQQPSNSKIHPIIPEASLPLLSSLSLLPSSLLMQQTWVQQLEQQQKQQLNHEQIQEPYLEKEKEKEKEKETKQDHITQEYEILQHCQDLNLQLMSKERETVEKREELQQEEKQEKEKSQLEQAKKDKYINILKDTIVKRDNTIESLKTQLNAALNHQNYLQSQLILCTQKQEKKKTETAAT